MKILAEESRHWLRFYVTHVGAHAQGRVSELWRQAPRKDAVGLRAMRRERRQSGERKRIFVCPLILLRDEGAVRSVLAITVQSHIPHTVLHDSPLLRGQT